MWSKAFVLSFLCQIYYTNAEFGQFPICKWDVHNCGHVEVICGGIKETVHLDAKHSNRSHDLTKYLHHPSTVSSRQQSLEQCFAIRDDDKGKFGNYEMVSALLEFLSGHHDYSKRFPNIKSNLPEIIGHAIRSDSIGVCKKITILCMYFQYEVGNRFGEIAKSRCFRSITNMFNTNVLSRATLISRLVQ